MALSASLNFNVPPLPDNDVWFINAAAWTNYWNNIKFNVEFDPVVVQPYVSAPYVDANFDKTVLNIDDVEVVIVTKDQFNALLNQLNTLDEAFQNLRTDLKSGGMITDNPA